MQLGFVTAILPNQPLEEVFRIASEIGYDCIEVMCWPPGKAERRYAGVTHIDTTQLTKASIDEIKQMSKDYSVDISALGYYPNPLTSDRSAQQTYVSHINHLIRAASRMDIPIVNTFIGRDQNRNIEDNLEIFKQIWTKILGQADAFNIKVGIENCPMLFTQDEWPGGQNLAVSPAIWRKMWKFFPTPNFGLNYDPSHMIIQHMNTNYPITQFPSRIHHVHAKDATIDRKELNEHGVFAYPNLWHTPKLPGLGDVDWKSFFDALKGIGYDGAVCVEVEDRDYEGSLESRIDALRKSHDYLRQFI